jgi:hypothetical protein
MQEDLFTAARRLVRYLNIDLQHGGLVTNETEKALSLLELQMREEAKRRGPNGENNPNQLTKL